MTFPKFLFIASVLLFATIGVLAFFKGGKARNAPKTEVTPVAIAIPITLEKEIQVVQPQAVPDAPVILHGGKTDFTAAPKAENVERPLPEADRIFELFNKGEPKLPFVETIVYKSRVSWQKGRPAWLSDYAGHYRTSRHFIARSLNGKPDYLRQDISEGDSFNVFRADKNIQFHMVIDTSRCKMWLYALDLDANERTLLKSYVVSLGRFDSQRSSGLLTPHGKYSLGERVAIYGPTVKGHYNGKEIEMVRVFGSRWIPFEKEIGGCTAPAKGLGLHGVPWIPSAGGALAEDRSSLGKYESDGCIRLATEDIEEIFAIILTKPTVIELVKDFYDAKLPGAEIVSK
jgi:hypothetical protein